MLNIFKYTNYRKFLKTFYNQKKKSTYGFSLRFFAKKAELNSSNYLKLVMDGKRNLTHKNVKKFAQGLDLTERETLYFENLVFMNQAKSDEEKEFYNNNLKVLKEDEYGTALTMEQYEVCSKWYYLVLKEMLLLKDFREDPAWIAEKLDKILTKKEIADALDLLLKLNLIERDPKTKKLVPTAVDFITKPGVRSDAVKQYYKDMIEKSVHALFHQNQRERFFNSLTIAVNTKFLPEIFKKIRRFRNELDRFILKTRNYDSVYQFNIQFFRLINK